MDKADCAVIGAGVVGLAVARALAAAGREVLLLEKNDAIGAETSSRNSEVIHAGLYYAEGSLKARLCRAGNEQLYRYCAERGIPHRRLGKLVVAADESELGAMGRVRDRALANGVTDIAWLDRDAVSTLEPELRCVAALLSPSTGIVDSHRLMVAFLADAQARGATLVLRSPVEGGSVSADGIVLRVGGADPVELRCRSVVNAAGLHATEVARSLRGVPEATIPRSYLCKGNYFTLAQRTPFRRLVYPVPEAAGLGVHMTLDLGGHARFGPDVEWVDAIDYRVDPRRADVFYPAIRRYWPGLRDGALEPGYAGIRPKIQAPGEEAVDFCLQGPRDHGVAGLVNLYGIESPGLTASLALGAAVARLL
ncbi:MAG: NAD(P)/FAD-dependent oxidoreductase [Deltaproteobacteria bacterium]|nr:NAD(P)/FAD-dependent oxidoreductase [Deltaproteobacteria bacterium]